MGTRVTDQTLTTLRLVRVGETVTVRRDTKHNINDSDMCDFHTEVRPYPGTRVPREGSMLGWLRWLCLFPLSFPGLGGIPSLCPLSFLFFSTRVQLYHTIVRRGGGWIFLYSRGTSPTMRFFRSQFFRLFLFPDTVQQCSNTNINILQNLSCNNEQRSWAGASTNKNNIYY